MTRKNFFTLIAVSMFFALCVVPSAFAQGGIKGKLKNNKGAGISGAKITARVNGKDIKAVTTDSKGNFMMQGLDPGTYNIAFDADGYSTGVRFNVEIKNGSMRDLGDRLILSVDQGTQILVKGSVFFKEGTSVTAAKVEIERVNDDGSTKTLGTTYTSMSGEFTFRMPLGASKLRVTAKYKGVSGSKEIEDVVNAGIYRTAITLDISRGEK
jgi:hypothetical protein